MTYKLRVLSLCSGISAASVAFAGLPMEMVGYSEIDPFACHLLHERFGVGRPKYMPDPAEPGIKKSESKNRAAAIKAVADIPEEGRVPNFGDWHNAAGVCSLSRVLEMWTPEKYSLSPTARSGILHRAEKRGKALPALLEKALASTSR